MICILARDRNPDYYEQLKEVLTAGLIKLTVDIDCCGGYCQDCEYTLTCKANNCSSCEYSAICGDVNKAILFLEQEQLRAELKRQKRLP